LLTAFSGSFDGAFGEAVLDVTILVWFPMVSRIVLLLLMS
jgi:hypothetical protein